MIFPAGHQVLASELEALVAAPVVPYVATWTATTSNPVIGNGTIVGAYQLIGNWIRVWGKITAGSTTTYGTGTYEVSLPFAANANVSLMGTSYMRNSGTADYLGMINPGSTTSVFQSRALTGVGTNAAWTPTSPFTFGTADSFSWLLDYSLV